MEPAAGGGAQDTALPGDPGRAKKIVELYTTPRKSACAPHRMQETNLKRIVPNGLRRVTHFARMKKRLFAARPDKVTA